MRNKRVLNQLKPLLDRRLSVYTLAAAAGFGSATTTANAAVVYTSARQFAAAGFGRVASIPIDLNHDGLVDFNVKGILTNVFSTNVTLQTALVYAEGVSSDQLAASGSLSRGPEAEALHLGQWIGGPLAFEAQRVGLLMAVIIAADGYPETRVGNFFNQTNKFLALKFSLSGQACYGWARVNVKAVGNNFVFELVDYAYQDTPNVLIRAGEGIPHKEVGSLSSDSDYSAIADILEQQAPLPSGERVPATLGMLAYGSEAISAWRR